MSMDITLYRLSLDRQERIKEELELLKKGYNRAEIVQQIMEGYSISENMIDKDLKILREYLKGEFEENQTAQAGLALQRYEKLLLEADGIEDTAKRVQEKRKTLSRIDVIVGNEVRKIHPQQQINVYNQYNFVRKYALLEQEERGE